MKLKDFDYELPEDLIAQSPIEPRDHSRLLILDKQSSKIQDKYFYNIGDELGENDVLVVNETRSINARLYGFIERKLNSGLSDGELSESQSLIGGVFEKIQSRKLDFNNFRPVEILLHKQISLDTWECLGYPGKNLKVGRNIRFYDENGHIILNGYIEKISEMGRYIKFDRSGFDFLQIIEKIGELPLPHYITKKLENLERYQTVYSKTHGSAASPTAGLHFTKELLENLEKKGVIIEKILLHVGVGTFKPVEAENILDHQMHSEYIEIKEDVSQRLNEYKKSGKRIIAVGTTSVRTLESFTDENGNLGYGNKETAIFIYPGYRWRFVESIITNFHLPMSTLIMLVSSFAGGENTKKAYSHAIENKYRFFSFGDAMWIR